MKRFFSLLSILTLIGIFTILTPVKAQEACTAKVVVHYHRFDNNVMNYEFHTWDNGTGGTPAPVAVTSTDDFGGVAEITICNDAKDQIGLIPKVKGTWDKDGIDVDNNGDIDNKMIDVADIRGTSNTKHVYVVQGSAEVYYQNVLKEDYFGKPNHGNLVVVYYDPAGNDDWEDFWTFWENTNKGVPFDYNLGISGGKAPNLFRVAVLSVPATADDQIGFIPRKNMDWAVKDDAWKTNLTADVTDENGHTYKTNGDRLINVTDIKGNGTKFVFVISGMKDIFEDYDLFLATAFRLELTQALFRSTKALTVTFNQNISYDETGPDKTKFVVKDETGNTVDIERVTYNSLVTSGNTFNLVLKNDVQNRIYTVTYNYEQFGEQKVATTNATFIEGLFPTPPANNAPNNNMNYTLLTVAGIVVVAAAGVGIFMALSRNKR